MKVPPDQSVRLVQITENEARWILQWSIGPEIAGLQPTIEEIALADKMRVAIASFEVGRTLTIEEIEIIRKHRADMARGQGNV